VTIENSAVRVLFDDTQRYVADGAHIIVRQQIVKRLLPDVTGMRILDLGCGDGRLSLQFAQAASLVTLVDLSDRMLARARSNVPADCGARLRFVRANGLTFRDQPYDVVLCVGVLAHVPSVEGMVARAAQLTRDGGLCIFQVTDAGCLVGKLQYAYLHLRHRVRNPIGYQMNWITRNGLCEIAARHGLDLVTERRHSMLLPGMGRLSPDRRVRYDSFVMNTPLLSRHAQEVLAMFRRSDPLAHSPGRSAVIPGS